MLAGILAASVVISAAAGGFVYIWKKRKKAHRDT